MIAVSTKSLDDGPQPRMMTGNFSPFAGASRNEASIFSAAVGPEHSRGARGYGGGNRTHACHGSGPASAACVSAVRRARAGPIARAGDQLSHRHWHRGKLSDGLSCSIPAYIACDDRRRVWFSGESCGRNRHLAWRTCIRAALVSDRPCRSRASSILVWRLAAFTPTGQQLAVPAHKFCNPCLLWRIWPIAPRKASDPEKNLLTWAFFAE